MPRLNHENLGSIQQTAYLTATVVSTDSEFDTMSFTGIGQCPPGSNVPIFYHCDKDSVQRDNGALEGASGAFSEGDEVIVQCEVLDSTTYLPLYVIGFVDKPKGCCFSNPFTDPFIIGEETFPWILEKRARGDGLLDHITSITGPLNFSAIFDKPGGAPYPAIFKGGSNCIYRITDLDLPSCKYFIFKLTSVNIIYDHVGWSGGCSGQIAIILSPGGSSLVSVQEGAVPGLYYQENYYPDRKISGVLISGGYYHECRDWASLHNEVNMEIEYLKMSNEIPEGAIEIAGVIPI